MDRDLTDKISNIPVAFEDRWLAVVDKPPGLLTIPAPDDKSRTLTGILNAYVKQAGLAYNFHPCHRLDRETSGLIIYAKGKSLQKKVMDLFRERQVKKTYLAFVQKNLRHPRGSIKRPVNGKNAITDYRVIEKANDFDVVEVSCLSGRKNQIRIHFKGIGHPLVGESRFAFRRDFRLKAKRTCLHAKVLEFPHPVTGEHLKIDSKLPSDMESFLKKNRR
ncbi:RluA family pseudouridine synthase [Candidatus Omnitrophota bacterium]